MVDELEFESPFGPIGWVVDRLILQPYMARFLRKRCDWLKRHLESSRPA